jgi:hypothetical protein
MHLADGQGGAMTTPAALHDDLTSEERATLYLIAVYASGRATSARFAVAQPSVVARVRRLRDRGLVDCEPMTREAGGVGVFARLTALGNDVVARSLRSVDALLN